MTPMLLALIAVFVAFVGGALAAGEDARWWRVAAGLAVATVALSLALGHAPDHQLGSDLVAQARQGDAPAHITVILQREGARRQIRQLPLRQPIPGSGLALLIMAALGLAGLTLSLQNATGRKGALAAVLPLAGGLFALASLAGAGGTMEGEAGVRAFLEQFSDLATLHLTEFTVPEAPWTFHAPGFLAVGAVSALALVTTITGVRPMPARGAHRFIAAGAALATAAVIWRLLQVGGLPWRGPELALWGTAILLGAALSARRVGPAASLVALAATIITLGLSA